MYLRTNYGLGSTADLPQGILGTGPVDCTSYFTWTITPECWKYSPSAWQQIVAFQRPTSAVIAPPPAVPAAYGTVAAPYDCAANPAGDPSCPGYDAAVSASLAAGAAQTQQNLSEFFASQPVVPGSSSGTNWLLWGALGLGAFALVAVGGGSARRYGR